MPTIRWRSGDSPGSCLVCGASTTRLVAAVDANFLVDVRVGRCDVCASLRVVSAMHEYTSDDRAIDDYVEGGAGIDAIALGLCRVRPDRVRRFLDVGCNYGFGVHIAARLFGWDALGLEPSPAGRRGQAELGVPIRSDMLDERVDLGEPFDLVLASEVLEHVTDPADFLAQVRRRLSPSGVLVLTTPAAEVMTQPVEREEEALQALSPGFHYFLASTQGMRLLLEAAGFHHHHVVREGLSLQVVAAVTAEGWDTIAPRPTLDQGALLGYLDAAAQAAQRDSALASGMATRHFRLAVMLGDFDAAERSISRVRDTLLARTGFDLDDPVQAMQALASGVRPSWNLPGTAYAFGMLEFLHRQRAGRAAEHFALSASAALAWRGVSGLLDVDIANLLELSLGHRCLALAAADPSSAADATGRISEAVAPATARGRLRTGWWQARTMNELVARGHLEAAATLVTPVAESVASLVSSGDPDMRRTGRDSMFLLGVRALNTGDPSEARRWFTRCARACAQADADDEHASTLAQSARDHDQLAMDRGGDDPAIVDVDWRDPGVVVTLEVYWRDTWGVYVRGFAHAGKDPVRSISVSSGATRSSQAPGLREDVAALYPEGSVHPGCGFALYLPAPPDKLDVELDTSRGVRRTRLELPSHPLPVGEPRADRSKDVLAGFLTEAGDGPILTLGRRLRDGAQPEGFTTSVGNRRVVNIDIHDGNNVDVVGDVHRLSHIFPRGVFTAAYSESLLEHVVAPWLVAAEVNRVLALGALVLHYAPTAWPEHASPNDFWRFTADGLAVLFGPSTGFELVDGGTAGWARIHPEPVWRAGQLDMPVLSAGGQAWILARKVCDIGDEDVRWPYDPAEGERRAKLYPVDGIRQS
ncbi:MAG: methyltransferase domain-containing protein [Candidatus Dormibacteraeota bacterium]|uniref:Methyltransferase domain-containing protein n=1 Tax=Candidatus Amunia macphersoniae TaxID=3127014 RepID=A0A934NJK0_9BACT|nr:methyltransferase domain-containing protein [Candidatus Dormibacteraeota bacterium]